MLLGTTLTKDGSYENDIRIRLALATSAMLRLYFIWNCRHIQFKLKYNLYRSLIILILTYGCEAWTINAAMQKKLQEYKNKSHRKVIDYRCN